MTNSAPELALGRRNGPSHAWLFPTVASIAMLALAATFAGVVTGNVGALAALGIQLLAALAAAGVAWVMRWNKATLGSSLMFASWVMFGGFLGAVIWLSLIVGPIIARRKSRLAATDALAFDKAEQLQNALQDNRLRIEGAHTISRLRDTFLAGTQGEKFRALSAIARRYEAPLAPALRTALKDRDPAVRVLASSVMAYLEARYLGRVRAATLITHSAETDVAGWRRLAEALHAYAESGLLQSDRRLDALKRADEAWDKAGIERPAAVRSALDPIAASDIIAANSDEVVLGAPQAVGLAAERRGAADDIPVEIESRPMLRTARR